MLKLKRCFPYLRKNNDGFTLIETLISLSIISLISLCFFCGIAVTTIAYSKSNTEAKKANIILNTDLKFRKAVNSVRIPFWVNHVDFSFTQDSISFGWVDGIDRRKTFNFENVDIQKVVLISKNGQCPVGVTIDYEINGSPYTTSCLFGTFSYGELAL